MRAVTGRGSPHSRSRRGWAARRLPSGAQPPRAGLVSACFRTVAWGAGGPRGIHLSASRAACRIAVVRAAGGGQWQRTQGPGTCIHMDRFQERERSLSQVLFEPVRRRLCNAKESLSLGDERVYVRAFMFFGAQVISLNALHGPFISLLSSEVQQNRQPNPPF